MKLIKVLSLALTIAAFFVFFGSFASALNITFPVGNVTANETYAGGDVINITWINNSVDDNFRVDYTTDYTAGCPGFDNNTAPTAPWIAINNSNITTTWQLWTIPNNISNNTVKIMVTGQNSTDLINSTYCTGNFTITQRPNYNFNSTSVANNTAYSPGVNYGFQINWTDDFGVDTVFFESNLNSSLNNFTVSCTGTSTSKICIINFTDLKAGNYQYRWISNDTNNTFNNTFSSVYSISKNITVMNLWLNDTQSDKSFIPNVIVNFTVQLNVPSKVINMTMNMTGFDIQNSTTSVIYNTTNMTQTGLFNVTAWFNGDENYTSASQTRFVTIDSTAPIFSLNSTNNTFYGNVTLFSLRWNDDFGLNGFIFSLDNGTGSFVNDSFVAFSGTSDWTNVTKVVNFTTDVIIKWKVYANDTANNMNTSQEYSFKTIFGSVDYVSPTDSNNSNVRRNWTYVNVTTSLSRSVDTCLLEWNSTANITMTKGSTGPNNFCYFNNTDIDGNYSYRVFINDTNNYFNFTEKRSVRLDVTPPKTITGLASSAKGTTFITWSWTNPTDPDFKLVMVYKDGVFLSNVTSNTVNFTGLSVSTTYTISTRTVDNLDNVNTTWVNTSDTTNSNAAPPSPPSSPGGTSISTKPQNATANETVAPVDKGIVGLEVSQIEKKLFPNKTAVFNIDVTGFRKIFLNVNDYIPSVRMLFQQLLAKPEGVPVPDEKVYGYYRIDVETPTIENIKNATITFFVNRNWLLQNNFDPKSIVLATYSNSTCVNGLPPKFGFCENGLPSSPAWEYLKTDKVGEDFNSIYYSAFTTHFSVYAILAGIKIPSTEIVNEGSQFSIFNLTITWIVTGMITLSVGALTTQKVVIISKKVKKKKLIEDENRLINMFKILENMKEKELMSISAYEEVKKTIADKFLEIEDKLKQLKSIKLSPNQP